MSLSEVKFRKNFRFAERPAVRRHADGLCARADVDLLEEKDRNNATETLVRLLHDNRDHLNTGFVGTPYLCHVLSGFGHHDLACKLLLHTDLPSWLYPVTKGATTIWEHWDGIREDGSFWDDIMNSFNHYSYGSIGDWMYQEIAGIQVDEKIPGYRHILLRPRLANGMCFARAVYESALWTDCFRLEKK